MTAEVAPLLALPAGRGPLQRAAELERLLAAPGGAAAIHGWRDGSRHGNSLVHCLAQIGDTDCIEALAESRADLNVQRASDLCTPLHLAIWYGQTAAADCLKRLGADENSTNSYGETARDAQEKRERRYVCWHQQADLLMNVAPTMLRRLFQERWVAFAGPQAEIGRTILEGSADRIEIAVDVSVRQGSWALSTPTDLRGNVYKGQRLWVQPVNVEVEAAAEPTWRPAAGRWAAECEVSLSARWTAVDTRGGVLEAQRVPPELRLPPGNDAFRKIRSGKVEDWDVTLLAHFCGEEHCQLSHRLVPAPDHRKLVRELKDVRNKAALHLGRAEIDPQALAATSALLLRACAALAPAMLPELDAMIRDACGKTVVPETKLNEMEARIREEHDRATLLDGQLTCAARFCAHVPPAAFAPKGIEVGDGCSDWSATRVGSLWAPLQAVQECSTLDELCGLLVLPAGCDLSVARRCAELLAAFPADRPALVVVRTAATSAAEVMLEEVSCPEVHRKWKARRLSVAEVQPHAELVADWSLPDGVLVSGEQGRVLRVAAQFRPPARPAGPRSRAGGPLLEKAMDLVAAVPAVAFVRKGDAVLVVSSEAPDGHCLQLADSFESCDCGASRTDDAGSIRRGAETATEAEGDVGTSTARKVGSLFWPFMQQREEITRALRTQVAEQVARWADGSATVTAVNAELVSETTAKWIWQVFEDAGGGRLSIVQEALRRCGDIVGHLERGGFEEHVPRLLLPMGEVQLALGRRTQGEDLLNRARKLADVHGDFEIGFSAHHSLFRVHMNQGNTGAAKVFLLSSQRLLDREAGREGPGMEQFLAAKQLFHDANVARLDAKLALSAGDPEALRKVQAMLEDTTARMAALEGSSYRGNTHRNIAELFCLLAHVATSAADLPAACRASERELALRRARGTEPKVVDVLLRLGRTCLQLADVEAAEKHLSEAEVVLQSLVGATATADPPVTEAGQEAPGPRAVPPADPAARAQLWQLGGLLADCAERRGEPAVAAEHLRRAAAADPVAAAAAEPGLRERIARLEAKARQRGQGPERQQDERTLDELASFIEGGASATSGAKKGRRRAAAEGCKDEKRGGPAPAVAEGEGTGAGQGQVHNVDAGEDAQTEKQGAAGKKKKRPKPKK